MQQYDDYPASQPNARARLSAFAGFIGIALAPVAVVLSRRLASVTLLMAVFGIAAGSTVFGVIAIALAKRARLRRSVSLGRMGGAKQAAFGRITGKVSLGLGIGACVALVVYQVMASR